MKLVLFFASWVSILSDVHAETSAEIKVPYAIITSGNMLDNIMRLQGMVINMSWELGATKTDLKTTKVALKTTEEKLESVLSEISRLNIMDKRIEEIANVTDISRIKSEVAFQAIKLKYPYTPGKNEALKFDDVSMNKGGGYNSTSGIFTVPRTGTYVCFANILPDNSNAFNIRLMKEGQVMVKDTLEVGHDKEL